MADSTSVNQSIYHRQEGDVMVVASGGEIVIESGGALTIESGANFVVENGSDIHIESGGDLQVTSDGLANGFFGNGSILARMCNVFKKNNPNTELHAICISVTGGTAATGTLKFASSFSATAGVWSVVTF